MHLRTYRLIVLGTIASSFLAGFHLPALHDMIEHGAAPRWDVLTVTVILAAFAVSGSWRLLVGGPPPGRGPRE